MGNKIYIELPLPSKKQVIIFFIIVFFFSILLGSTLAYSISIKIEGDKQYKNQNYATALSKYRFAQQWWLLEKISFKLRDRDLYFKLSKAEIMVKSDNNFSNGVKSFENKKYIEAEKYLNNVVLKDPHYQEAQKILAEINKLLIPSPTPTIKIERTAESSEKQQTTTYLEPSYKYDPDYPIIVRFEGFGETFYHSYGNGISSSKYVIDHIYHPGDTLHFKFEAKDPKGRNINYKIELNNSNETVNSNEANFVLSDKDISDERGVTAGITIDAPTHRFSGMDDYVQFSFKVRP